MIVRKFNRVLLKLSGESLKDSSSSQVLKPEILDYLSEQIELIIKNDSIELTDKENKIIRMKL